MRAIIVAGAALLLASVVSAQTQTRLAWDMDTTGLSDTSVLSYQIAIDGAAFATVPVTCAGALPKLVCTTPLPAMTPGTHTILVRAMAGVVEGLPSSPFPVAVPGIPAAVRITR